MLAKLASSKNSKGTKRAPPKTPVEDGTAVAESTFVCRGIRMGATDEKILTADDVQFAFRKGLAHLLKTMRRR